MVTHFNPLHENSAVVDTYRTEAQDTISNLTMPCAGTVHPEQRPDSMVKHHNPLHESTLPAALESETDLLPTVTNSPPAASQLPAHSATQDMRAKEADVTVSDLTMPKTGAARAPLRPFNSEIAFSAPLLELVCML